MPDDYMSDTPDESGGATKGGEEKSDKSTRTALLPISFFEGKDVQPGSVCEVKVERVEEDQVEVSYVPHSEEEASEDMGAEAPSEDMMA